MMSRTTLTDQDQEKLEDREEEGDLWAITAEDASIAADDIKNHAKSHCEKVAHPKHQVKEDKIFTFHQFIDSNHSRKCLRVSAQNFHQALWRRNLTIWDVPPFTILWILAFRFSTELKIILLKRNQH